MKSVYLSLVGVCIAATVFAQVQPGANRVDSVYSPEGHLFCEAIAFNGSQPSVQQEYVWFGNRPIAQFDGGQARFTFADHLGAPVIQTDGAATVLWRGDYEPYGAAQIRTGQPLRQPLRLPGQEAFDAGNEREYNIQRWYRPNWGRYTQPDPITLPLPIASVDLDPMAVRDLYSYASESPVLRSDRMGLYDCTYSIDEHLMICTPTEDPNNPTFRSSHFVAGRNGSKCRDCRDNPDRTDVSYYGPPPVGDYRIGVNRKRTMWRNLDPATPNGRYDLRLHGCSNPATCSHGCIAATLNADRDELDETLSLEEGHNTLHVVASIPPTPSTTPWGCK